MQCPAIDNVPTIASLTFPNTGSNTVDASGIMQCPAIHNAPTMDQYYALVRQAEAEALNHVVESVDAMLAPSKGRRRL